MPLRVTVAVALADRQSVVEVEVPEGSTVADAIRAARLEERYGRDFIEEARFGVWSRPCPAHTELREGDRVELYRPLAADPKQMRRTRAKRAR
jgi:putative ubiquitin-RnfH superfamily antitoxin RatB of RatAB toxin-antitoxin module